MATNPLGGGTGAQWNVFFSLTFDTPVMVVANAFNPNRRDFPMVGRAKTEISGWHRVLLRACGSIFREAAEDG